MIQEGLVTLLAQTGAITAILGTPATRSDKSPGVFGVLALNQATLPYIVLSRVSGKPVMSFQGANQLHDALFRFTCYGTGYTAAAKLAEQVKILFADFIGALPGPGAVVVSSVEQTNEMDDTEAVPHGTIYAVHMDFAFMYVDNQGA